MKTTDTISPLPATKKECHARNWNEVDIVLITGDAYVDHPSFGVALIGRLLESKGYRVAILAQPRYDSNDDFHKFGRPRLFFGITGGNLDSIVANYTGNGKVREKDSYSPDGNPWFGKKREKTSRRRPDRASMLYTNLARSAYKDVPIILGGVEASLRRFTHYDYKQKKLRGSLLSDAKADLIVYGMGEHAITQIADRLNKGYDLTNIAGTCERLSEKLFQERQDGEGRETILLPSWQEISQNKALFLQAEKEVDSQARSYADKQLIQKQQSAWILQHPQPPKLTTKEMDSLYELPFTRCEHPAFPNVPAARMIQHSLTTVRGCSGNCSFCAITRHQGPAITSRSQESLLREAKQVSSMKNFKGTISDLGGPTANLFGVTCRIGSCKKHDCLYPKVCKNLQVDEKAFLSLLRKVSALPKIKNVFISSGLRLELLLRTPALFKEIIRAHTPGAMKIAPEHTEAEVLELMHKESHAQLRKFLDLGRKLSRELKKDIYFSPYIISSHPGCRESHTINMAKTLQKLGLELRQFQDFTPTPGTLATAMYVTGLHRDTEKPIFVARGQSERMKQRRILERLLHPQKNSRPIEGSRKQKRGNSSGKYGHDALRAHTEGRNRNS
ncbi:MAG TPA: YgiQ family radical SAM protein [Desulfocapsa sulfexigens]|nr:YgiQ family radical SAM protein [Desulfocapsa sulfexigens]